MNILYLIGNGFDLAQGLKTSYQDFYEFLKAQNPINSVGALMLDHIKSPEVELWKDMELKLGEFTKEVTDKEKFEEFYYDLCEKLRTHLIAQADSFSPSKGIQDKYIRDIVSPYEYLNVRERVEYRQFISTFNTTRVVNIVSFNYTDVFDKVIYGRDPKVELPAYNYQYILQPTTNVHGKLNSPYILMGVNDVSQIKNPDFAGDEDICDYLVKPQSNFGLGNMIDDRVDQLISESSLIVTMGLSFGETDSYWWEKVGSRLKHDPNIRIILFEYIKNLPSDPRKHLRIMREKRKEFLSRCCIADSEYEKYSSYIYVCLNKGLFSPNTTFYNDDRKGL